MSKYWRKVYHKNCKAGNKKIFDYFVWLKNHCKCPFCDQHVLLKDLESDN